MIYNLKLPLDEYQLKGADYCRKHKYVCVGDKMGLGKTAQALAVMTTHPDYCWLVVAPGGLTRNWEREVNKFTFLSCSVAKTVEEVRESKEKNQVTIISNSLLEKLGAEAFRLIDGVVADEAHAFKNITARRTKLFDELLYKTAPEYCLLLTGTPIENRVVEFYNLLVLLSYEPNGKNGENVLDHYPTQYKFNLHFSNKKEFKVNGRRIIQWKGLKKGTKKDLQMLLKGKYYRRTKGDTELPELRDKEVFISYKKDPKLQAEWDEFVKNSGKSSTEKAKSALKKVKFTASYVEGVLEEDGGPVVIFTDHLDSYHALMGSFPKLRVLGIHGGLSSDKKDEVAEKFQAGRADILVITRAAREGLNLFRAAHLVVNDLPWVPGWMEQIVKRIHRKGQTRDCLIHYIFGSYQDAHIRKTLEEKSKELEELL